MVAIENGLTAEVVPELRDLYASHPEHRSIARMTNVSNRLGEPCGDPEFDRFQKALGSSPGLRGPHLVLFHQRPTPRLTNESPCCG